MDRNFVREVPLGYLQITSLNAVKSFATQWAAAFPSIDLTAGPVILLIDAESQAVRWRFLNSRISQCFLRQIRSLEG